MILGVDILTFATPFLALAMFVEIGWTHRARRHQYRVNDTLACITVGIMSTFVGLLGVAMKASCYLFVFTYLRLTDMRTFSVPLQVASWLFLFLAQDFAYYWFHRIAHRVNVVWASHIVHHSSDEYNLAVAFRQSSFQQFISWTFYLPLVLIGYPPEWLIIVVSINLIYQFWIHTREVERMPAWYEAIFNTPSARTIS